MVSTLEQHARATPASPATSSTRRLALLGACAVGLVVLVGLLYLSSVHSSPGSSDGATVILEGQAMSGGNFMLNHWALSLDSFWLVDVLAYAVAVLIGGVHPQLLHLVPSLVAVGVICVSAWIAQRGRDGWAGVAAAAAVVVMLGLPTHAFAEFFLMGPLHVTTTLWCLVAFIALRKERFGWGWLLATGILAAGMLGDLQTAALGVAPVALAGIVAMLRMRSWRTGAPALSAAIGSVALAEAVRRIARLIGTFTIGSANPRASLHQMLLNLHHVVTYGAALEGVGYHPFGDEAVPPVLEAAHGVGLTLGVLAVVMGVFSLVWSSAIGQDGARTAGAGSRDSRESLWLEDVLVFAFFGGCAVFIWLSVTAEGAFARYLTSAVIFGSILAGRLVGKIAERARLAPPRALLAGAGLLVTVGYAATFVSTLTVAVPKQSAVRLADYLEAHHLTRGVGDYWSASIVTVESANAVVIRPVVSLAGGHHLARYMRQTSSTWYGGGFEFLVYNAAVPWGSVGSKSAAASFGPPQHVAVVGTYYVLTWAHDLAIPRDGSYAPQSWAHR